MGRHWVYYYSQYSMSDVIWYSFIITESVLTSLEAFPRQRQNDERRAENDEDAYEQPLER